MNKRFMLAVVLMVALVGMLNVANKVQVVRATEPIYIRADGSIDPKSAPISSTNNITYVFTGNIANSLAVERDNIIIDGADNVLTGTGIATAPGILLLDRRNVTIENVNIFHAFGYGISLGNSSECFICRNNISDNYIGIYLHGSQDNTISDNIITGSNAGVTLDSSSSDNSVLGNEIVNNAYGIWSMSSSSNNSVSGNNITRNVFCGVFLQDCSSNSVYGNNTLRNNGFGIMLYSSSQNNILQNTLVANNNFSIGLISSNDNIVFGNNLIANAEGIGLMGCSGNSIHHNNFRGNAEQVYIESSLNVWDNGFEGNFWSDYGGTDSDNDGIGDTPYNIDEYNQDNYPLMGLFSVFNATLGYTVQTICNSSISDFQYNGTSISFNVTGEKDTTGFCRICIPTALMNDTFRVFVNGTEILPSPEPLPCSNSTHIYLYFAYSHSTQEVIIIPEFPSFLILPLSMIATLVAAIVYRRKRTI